MVLKFVLVTSRPNLTACYRRLIWRANWQEKRLPQFGVKMPVYVNQGSLKHNRTSDECSLSSTKLSTPGFVS